MNNKYENKRFGYIIFDNDKNIFVRFKKWPTKKAMEKLYDNIETLIQKKIKENQTLTINIFTDGEKILDNVLDEKERIKKEIDETLSKGDLNNKLFRCQVLTNILIKSITNYLQHRKEVKMKYGPLVNKSSLDHYQLYQNAITFENEEILKKK